MEDEEFERLEKIEFKIKNNYEVQNEDLLWVINKIRQLDTMTNLMSSKFVTKKKTQNDIIEYYKEEATKRLCGK